jgi:cellulose synthase/poly-beta-1,6-N-acetylglucosamine synthase-like glycosyltransferase/spore germination protein YaaH/peptidoglycan/xylan/chitin deacetylase (PgdA/CDA1 family)
MSEYAVFFDPSRKRWGWVKRIGTVMSLFAVVIVSVFLISLATAPLLPGMLGITIPIKRAVRNAVKLPQRQTREQQFLLKKDRDRLLRAYKRDLRLQHARAALPPVTGPGIVAAFYAPWQETGLNALHANASKMTHLLPAWVHINEDGRTLDFHDWDPATVPHNLDVLNEARTNNLSILPVLSNAQQSDFDANRVHAFLRDARAQSDIILQLRNWCLTNRFQGINIDFENLHDDDYALLAVFLQRMKTSFAPHHLQVSADLEASRPVDWKAISNVCDFVIVMMYDEHAGSTPGPIASFGWYRQVLQQAVSNVPRAKLVVGLANYGYDWMQGRDWADPLTYQGALVQAKEYHPDENVDTIVDFDPEALNPTYSYVDDQNKEHEVWLLDAITAANQWSLAQSYGLRGVGIWVLGSTDPTLWKFIDRNKLNVPVNLRDLRMIEYPYDVEFVGEGGEISHVLNTPSKGFRFLEVDPATGLILDEVYQRFPTSYVIARTGYKEKKIALTIDDGPADRYTSEMLDELKQLNVKATFFLIGQNAERYPGLVRRIWREGHEIGNHSYTHPNIGAMPEDRARFELNATQRVFQSILHRSTLLFRPPYNADAEPQSAQEVTPIEVASSLNYITILEFLDPQDWNLEERQPDGSIHQRTAQDMLATLLAQLGTEKGNCVLLHDGGGDREETVKLIRLLVPELRRQGYEFVTVSNLVNSTRDAVNPPVTSSDTMMLANDRIVFELMYLGEVFLTIAFISAIVLGALRVLFVTVLALIARARERRVKFDEAYRPHVSVVIAAYNEEKVVARTIEAVLASNYPNLELIVVDDGSRDDTSGAVERMGIQSLRLVRQDNAGKAAALNNGISLANGEIIIALDADTIFQADTIDKLVRRFADPLVGAVAGNVKVGNRINPLTFWQAIEYITSQNLDRRAYSLLNSVSVVPGAVGAWRRTAILQAGGYTTDTMAEDMDLTWRIRRIGWRIETESEAIGYTEAPDSFIGLYKQRFRWAFGTLQCLWKHRRALGKYGWFGRAMLPSLWLFQVGYQVLSPVVDLQIAATIWVAAHAWMRGHLTADWQPLPQALPALYTVAFMYAFFFVIELIGAAVAFKLDREDGKMLVWLFWQRFLYRQLMYAVLLKSVKTAISGMRAGWGKLERKGTVEIAAVDVISPLT